MGKLLLGTPVDACVDHTNPHVVRELSLRRLIIFSTEKVLIIKILRGISYNTKNHTGKCVDSNNSNDNSRTLIAWDLWSLFLGTLQVIHTK